MAMRFRAIGSAQVVVSFYGKLRWVECTEPKVQGENVYRALKFFVTK